MICTFGDITDVIWWRELGLPVRAVIQANGAFKPVTWGEPGWESIDPARAQQAYDQLAGLSAAKARARTVELAPRERRPARRATADHACREVLREGRPSARDRHQPPVVHQDDGCARGAAGPRTRARVASALHAGAARELDQRPRRRLVHQPAAVLWCAVPGLVSCARGRIGRPRRAVAALGRSSADRPVDRRARRLHRGSARPARAGSPAIPTSWTPGRPRRCRRRLPAAGSKIRISSRACFRWTSVRRRTTSSGRGCSRRCCAPSSSTAVAAVEERGDLGLGARSRSQEDVEVEGQRRHAAGAPRGARVGRRALLGGERTAGRRHGVRLGPDESGPPARDQAAQRVEVRPCPSPGRAGPVTAASIAAC